MVNMRIFTNIPFPLSFAVVSALDIFGGKGVKFEDCIKWNNTQLS